jgi:Concanavalin A-like lectin/glucanases superfamily
VDQATGCSTCVGHNRTASGTVDSTVKVNDGQWHHAIVEADRRARTLTVYVDGKKEGSAEGVDASVSLANEGDFYVGGTPEGQYLHGALGRVGG